MSRWERGLVAPSLTHRMTLARMAAAKGYDDLATAFSIRRYAPHDGTLERFEREAREAGPGLWADADSVPPWEWRKR